MAVANAEPVDLDALQKDAERRIEQLREQRMRLAPEALTDSEVAAELKAIEGEIANCEAALERMKLAWAEKDRRSRQEQADAEAERRTAAMRKARELEAERRRASRAVDSALRRFATALRSFGKTTTAQERALRAGGWSMEQSQAARPRPWTIEAAVMRAPWDASCPSNILRLESFNNGLGPSHVKPLAENDAKVIEPAESDR